MIGLRNKAVIRRRKNRRVERSEPSIIITHIADRRHNQQVARESPQYSTRAASSHALPPSSWLQSSGGEQPARSYHSTCRDQSSVRRRARRSPSCRKNPNGNSSPSLCERSYANPVESFFDDGSIARIASSADRPAVDKRPKQIIRAFGPPTISIDARHCQAGSPVVSRNQRGARCGEQPSDRVAIDACYALERSRRPKAAAATSALSSASLRGGLKGLDRVLNL